MSKPWPKKLSKKDVDPSEYSDLSVETQRLVAHGDHVYLFVWCMDMDEEDNQVSVLFRVHRSFDEPAERLAAIKTEMVDLALHDGKLVALENGQNDDGSFGIVHHLAPGASAPESSTRLEVGELFKALGRGPNGTLFVGGNSLQRFDGKAWQGKPLPFDAHIEAIGGNGTITVAVGTDGLVLALEESGDWRVVAAPTSDGPRYSGVHVADDGTVSIAGPHGACLQGTLDALAPLKSANEKASFVDACLFQGKHYWSAAGDEGIGGLYVQKGSELELIFETQSCFQLTPTDDYLFIASEAGILRFDGKDEFKPVSTNYDEDEEVWVMAPGEPEEADDDDFDDEEDDDDDGNEPPN